MSQTIEGHAKTVAGLPSLIATDGSAVRAKTKAGVVWHTGFGWLSTDGRYGLGKCPIPELTIGREAAVVTELRAVYHALSNLAPNKAAVILLDSDRASRFLDWWAAGNLRMPRGYVGSAYHVPMLTRAARLVAAQHHRFAWSVVKGHDGHLLNEAADSLAKIARQWCSYNYRRGEASARARRLVEGFLADPRMREVA